MALKIHPRAISLVVLQLFYLCSLVCSRFVLLIIYKKTVMRLVHTSYAIKNIYFIVWSGHIVFTNNEQGIDLNMKTQASTFVWHSKHTYRRPDGSGLRESILKIGKALEKCSCPVRKAKLEGLLERQILKAQINY